MKKINIYNIAKILFIVFCAVFLLTACGSSSEGGTLMNTEDPDGKYGEDDLADMHRTCWQGSFLEIFYENLGKSTVGVYAKLTQENLLNVIMLAFSIWMAYQILQHVATTTPESLGEFWTKIIRKAFICVLCGLLASSQTQLFYTINTFIMPIYITILQFAANILEIMGKDPDASAKAIKFGAEEVCEPYNHSLNDAGCKIANMASVKFEGEKFPDEPLKMMSCMACAISDRLSVGYTVSINLMSQASVSAFLVGCFLIVCFTLAKVGFVFYIVDSIFRLNMMMIILPFLILFYPFTQTRKWTVAGFKIILSSSALMLCLAVLVSMSILAMQKMLIDPNMRMDFSDPTEYYNFGTVPLAMIFMGFLVVKASATAAELAGQMIGTEISTNFQKKTAALIGTIAKGVFIIVTWGSGKAITAVADHVEAVRKAIEAYRKAQAKIKRIKQKMDHLAGRDGGNQDEEGGEE